MHENPFLVVYFYVMRPTERLILDTVRSMAPFTKMDMSMGKQPIGRHSNLQDKVGPF